MTILEIMDSVKFKHFNLKQYHTEPVYSTGIIKHVLHPTNWKQPLHYGICFPFSFQPKLHNHSKPIFIGIANRHGLMPFFSKTPKEAIHGYFVLIPRSILQNYRIGSVNGRITLVASLNSFTHTMWLKKATNFSNIILEA